MRWRCCLALATVLGIVGAVGGRAAVGSGSPMAVAAETREIRITKVTDSPGHPGAKFSGNISGGAGQFSLQLAPGATSSAPTARTVSTGAVGIVEQALPAGWSLVGYALVANPPDTVCRPDLVYGPANVIPMGSASYLICIKNSYTPTPAPSGDRILRVGVVATSFPHPGGEFGINLSTGQSLAVRLGASEFYPDPVEVSIPTSEVRLAGVSYPSEWNIDREYVVPDGDGTSDCQSSAGFDGWGVPEGSERYLLCLEASYHSSELPRTLRLAVVSLSANHPGGSFGVNANGIEEVFTLAPDQQSSPTVLRSIPPPGQVTIGFEARSPGWRVVWYLALEGLSETCPLVLPVSVYPVDGPLLGPGSQTYLLCVYAAHLSVRTFLPAVRHDEP